MCANVWNREARRYNCGAFESRQDFDELFTSIGPVCSLVQSVDNDKDTVEIPEAGRQILLDSLLVWHRIGADLSMPVQRTQNSWGGLTMGQALQRLSEERDECEMCAVSRRTGDIVVDKEDGGIVGVCLSKVLDDKRAAQERKVSQSLEIGQQRKQTSRLFSRSPLGWMLAHRYEVTVSWLTLSNACEVRVTFSLPSIVLLSFQEPGACARYMLVISIVVMRLMVKRERVEVLDRCEELIVGRAGKNEVIRRCSSRHHHIMRADITASSG